MPSFRDASPRLSVRLYKTISRQTSDGSAPASARYQGKDSFIDLTPFLGDGSSVRTTKSVREPAGGFTVTFTDQPKVGFSGPLMSLESVYGLIEPMDVVVIRMWNGTGLRALSADYPIIMRGFVSDVSRSQTMGQDGRPSRAVTITGQDFGKIWQTYQVLYLPAYAEGKSLLTTFQLAELFGISVVSAMPAAQFVREMVEKVINPHIKGFLPDTLPKEIPKAIQTGDSIAVQHGKVNISFQQAQGSVYEILRVHGDVGAWNELYVEDREDGIHCVYRPIPALRLVRQQDNNKRKIHEDAPDPIYCEVPDSDVEALSVARSDSGVANFFWVNNSKFDLIDDLSRRLYALKDSSLNADAREYPNSSVKYYGVRPMYAETQQGDDAIQHMNGGKNPGALASDGKRMEAWIERRLRQLKETNQDNVVFERGSARVRGCPMRPDGSEAMKAGDYLRIRMGATEWDAYVHQIEHEFTPYQGYTTTLSFDRGEGFALRVELGAGASSPWVAEQALRTGGGS